MRLEKSETGKPAPMESPMTAVPKALKAPSPPASGGPGTVPFGKLPAGLRRLLLETPQKEWYRIKALRAKSEEAIELVHLAPVVDHILDVAPGKVIASLNQGVLSSGDLEKVFRNLRDSIAGVREACLRVARLARMELRALPKSEAAPPAPEARSRAPDNTD
jgi:hypothetical protein